MMKKREKTQWKMMKNRETPMKMMGMGEGGGKERKKQWAMMKKIGQNNAKWWKVGNKKRKHDAK